MKFYKSSLNSNSNRATYKEFFWCSGTNLYNVWWFVFFFFFFDLLHFGGYNFLISNLFLTIVSVSNAPKRGVQVLFGHQK
jgi:hypothetical protein